MKNSLTYLVAFVQKISLVFFIYTICRLIFFLANYTSLKEDTTIQEFFYGIRFDFVAIAFLFSPFVLLALLPIPNKENSIYKIATRIIFNIANILSISANLMDSGYFIFSQKRSTADIFEFLGTGNDLFSLLPSYLIDYWYLFATALVLIIGSDYLYKKIDSKVVNIPFSVKTFSSQLIFFLIGISLTFIGFRGGLQLKPLDIINAANYGSAKSIPVVLNTPFSIIKTVLNEPLIETTYFDDKTLFSLYNPELKIAPNHNPTKQNVVIFILESFAKEYVGFYNHGKGYTPFLDSLMQSSYVFTNAYSNGTRSIESLPSIYAGIPPLITTPYVISNFSANQIDALPSVLNKNGYNTSFYHGGENGTMGFDNFCATAGVSNYYGKNEYPDYGKYENESWGIPDEPYLQYVSSELNKKNSPFFSTIFTLSSHHPYTVPIEYKSIFKDGELPIHKTIRYTDFALKQFFEKVKKFKWYSNTLFIFTSDHSSEALSPIYSTVIGRNAIPMFIFDPSGKLKGTNQKYAQHTDITPTLLHILGIKASLFSFGNDILSTEKNYFVGYTGTYFYLAENNKALYFDGKITTGFFDYPADSLLKNNLIYSHQNDSTKLKMEMKIKAIIQQYYQRLKSNTTSLTAKK
ncbi:MAG: sulfatase-like hydrolase/transferase [Flavobacteriales bacterium]|nr:sulfatase-like hydrolase/transferase [Flavobacteriales bacterium]